jgi:selenocysteine lyase/cysteine desulfurase
LAKFLDVSAEELVLTRNTTESLNLVIMGFPWNSGDEVVIGNQDYGSMVEAFQQAANRFGIVVKVAQIPLLPKSDDEIIQAYASLISSKTRMLHLTHTINLTGQVIPVNRIVDRCLAYQPSIAVAVDAAHSTAHTIEKIGSLKADFIGGSLHKWLCTPLGLGYLVMKSDFIDKIWPLFGDVGISKNNIRRFEHQGTRPVHSIQSIQPAIEFHEMIGHEAKRKRLQYLKESILEAVDGKNGISCISPWKDKDRGGAVFCIQKEGLTPAEFVKLLKEKFRIFTVAIDHPVVKGIRITPHFSTIISDVQLLKNALLKI